MSHLAEIVLSVGTNAVEIGDIPRLIANAIHPQTNSTARVVSDLKKQMLDTDGALIPGLQPLTSDPLRDYESPEERLLEAIFIAAPSEKVPPMTDWALLNYAWVELPDFKMPLPETEWAQYADALEEYEHDNWRLVPEWDSEAGAITMLQLRAQAAHRNELAKALKTGELIPHSAITLLPGAHSNHEQRRFVTVAELKTYAARFNIAISVASLGAVTKEPPTSFATSWPRPTIAGKAPQPHKFDTNVKGPTDWKYWRHIETAELWQALLLSLNIEPPGNGWLLDNAAGRTGDIPYEYLDAHGLTDEFARRCRILRNRLETLHAATSSPSNVELTEFIGLPLFAAWAVEFEWENLPPEIVTLAQKWDAKRNTLSVVAQGQAATAHERLARLRFNELWSEGELQSIMCGDARRLFGSGHSASDSERKDAFGAILDGIGVGSLLVAVWRQVESVELFVAPDEVRYFKPDHAIAWVNRGRFPKFPFPTAPDVTPTADAPPVTPAALPVLQPQHSGQGAEVKGWQEQARSIADECFDRDTASNVRDSLKGYAGRVMKIMQERVIHGPRGRLDNPKTIARDALQGAKWWAQKSP